jgi:protein involved in polysaccharide export with SLBB domain
VPTGITVEIYVTFYSEVPTMIKFFVKPIEVARVGVVFASAVLACVAACVPAFGQTGKNNPYSPSPSPKVKSSQPAVVITPAKSGPSDVSFVMQARNAPVPESRPTIAETTFKIAKNADLKSRPPSEIYKVGVGDVLYVNLKNAAQGSGYYTVRPDGTIDFPLAGENVIVADQTVDTIEDILVSGITLFQSPQVEVKVRQYSSHRITVSGLVDSGGEKNLQREAMPLFAIRAEAGVSSKATKAIITRAPLLKVETYDLRDPKTDDVLVYPGNSIEFTAGGGLNGASYFIAGEVVSGGQKELTYGLTLYQAVVASGGAKGNPKKAVVRRKNDKGLFANTEYNLRSIKDGKSLDPFLLAGDVIEIRN